MKKKRVKYFAFKENFKDLTFVKDSVSIVKDLFLLKKFELYNIKVQKYDDLNINWCNYIDKTY